MSEVKARSVNPVCPVLRKHFLYPNGAKLCKSALCFLHAHPELQTFYCRFDVICFDFLQQFAKTIQQDFSKFTYDQQWIENAFTFDEEFINL